MFDRRELILKIAVGIAAALVLYELGLFVVHINPLWGVKIPALPSLPATATATASSKNTNAPAGKGTGSNVAQQVVASKATNSIASAQATNATTKATNGAALATHTLARATNDVGAATNQLAGGTNAVAKATNVVAAARASSGTASNNIAVSNTPTVAPMGAMAGASPGMPPGMVVMGPGGAPGMMGMGPHGGPGMVKPGPELSSEAQARVDRIIDSEILAPVMHPLPMALLGIAGPQVFLRAPNGQTGLIKEGEELGGVKLVRIGINRVLVDEKGEQKELTIFAGLGSDSLMSANKESPK